jgi:pimeloyl-ACP methyl ester carboxylesterase
MNPILLLHGALGSSEQLLPLKSLLEQTGRKVLTLNFSGHGGAAFADQFGIDQFGKETLQFITAQNLKQVDVFGYSMGGYVALYAALQQPLVFGTIVTLGTKFDWSEASSEQEVKKLNPEKIIEKVPAFAEVLSKRHGAELWKTLIQRTAEMMVTLGHNPLLNNGTLAKIKQQVVICLGDRDDMTSSDFSRNVAGQIPEGSFVLMTDTPHPIEKVNMKFLMEILLKHFD